MLRYYNRNGRNNLKNMKYWKFLNRGLKSAYNNEKWVIGKWKYVEGDISIRHNGYHASFSPLGALRNVHGEVIALVEGKGETDKQSDKIAFSDMRVVKAWRWAIRDSVALSIYAAKLTLDNLPLDTHLGAQYRPLVEHGIKWLTNPTMKNLRFKRPDRIASYLSWVVCPECAACLGCVARTSRVAWIARAACVTQCACRLSEPAIKNINSWIIKRTKEMKPSN